MEKIKINNKVIMNYLVYFERGYFFMFPIGIMCLIWLAFLENLGLIDVYDEEEEKAEERLINEIYIDIIFGGEENRLVKDLTTNNPEWIRAK